MQDQSCVFCKIIAHHIPAQYVAETDDILVIKDRAPKAPIHYLVMPKVHVKDIVSFEHKDEHLMLAMLLMAKTLALQLTDSHDFRLITNSGPQAGQSVFHVHFHFLSGQQMFDF